MNTSALIATFLLGAFLLGGMASVRIFGRRQTFMCFTVGMAFCVMLLLALLEILPEALEISSESLSGIGSWLHVIAFAGIGALALKLLDRAVPDHHSEHAGSAHVHSDLEFSHVGIMTALAIVIHNVIEGAGVYVVYSSSASLGILYVLSVGMHNIPMGMIVGAAVSNLKGFRGIALASSLVLSTGIGALAVALFSVNVEGVLFTASLLAASAGMLLYIAFFELLEEVHGHISQKSMIYGLVSGAAVFLASRYFLG